jgi:crossover junction endodeoxyribonuclease RusA
LRKPLTLKIPIPANEWMSANGRYSRHDRAGRTQRLRDRAVVHAYQARLPRLPRAHILALIAYPTRAIIDPANAYPTVKALIDGLCGDRHYKLLPDDSYRYLDGPDMRIDLDSPRPAKGWHNITFKITELSPGDAA